MRYWAKGGLAYCYRKISWWLGPIHTTEVGTFVSFKLPRAAVKPSYWGGKNQNFPTLKVKIGESLRCVNFANSAPKIASFPTVKDYWGWWSVPISLLLQSWTAVFGWTGEKRKRKRGEGINKGCSGNFLVSFRPLYIPTLSNTSAAATTIRCI